MKELKIEQNLSIRDFIKQIETLRTQYEEILTSFYYMEIKERNKFIKNTRDQIYSLKYNVVIKDKIWSYMNDYTDLWSFIFLLGEQNGKDTKFDD